MQSSHFLIIGKYTRLLNGTIVTVCTGVGVSVGCAVGTGVLVGTNGVSVALIILYGVGAWACASTASQIRSVTNPTAAIDILTLLISLILSH